MDENRVLVYIFNFHFPVYIHHFSVYIHPPTPPSPELKYPNTDRCRKISYIPFILDGLQVKYKKVSGLVTCAVCTVVPPTFIIAIWW